MSRPQGECWWMPKGGTKDWFDSQWPLWQTAFTTQHSLMSIRADDLPYHSRGSFITMGAVVSMMRGSFWWWFRAVIVFFFFFETPLWEIRVNGCDHISGIEFWLKLLPDARDAFLCHLFLLSCHKFQDICVPRGREGTEYSIYHESSLRGVMSPDTEYQGIVGL